MFRYFAIFGMMRTGSNLLERFLNQFDGLTCHGELFNPDFIGTPGRTDLDGVDLAMRERDPGALLNWLAQGEGLHGCRIFDGHDPRAQQMALADARCAKIILTRDPLDAFISLGIARKTGQWLLGSAPARKTAQITFDPGAFAQYQQTRSVYYAKLDEALQKSGQSAFRVDYSVMKDPARINGLARWLGISDQRAQFDEPIKRQNPGSAASKLTNPEALQKIRAPTAPAIAAQAPADMAIEFLGLAKPPLLAACLPGNDRAPIAAMLRQLSGSPPEKLRPEQALEWAQCHPGQTSFARIEPPLTRIYRVFQRRIYSATHAYPKLRTRLAKHYNVTLAPENADTADTSAAFLAFLQFVAANIADQTSIRKDAEWLPQTRLLHGFAMPFQHLVHADKFSDFASDKFGLKPQQISAAPTPGLPLAQIVTRPIAQLCAEIYGADHAAFGLDPAQVYSDAASVKIA